MLIRDATTADEDAVLLLIEAAGATCSRPASYAPGARPGGLRWMMTSPDAQILVAEDAGALIGLATLYRVFPALRSGWRCWLQDLVVKSSRRGNGAGRALLDAATGWAREHGCTHLMLDSGNARKDAHRFYLREGMAQESLTFKRQVT
jgi:PhnO protein